MQTPYDQLPDEQLITLYRQGQREALVHLMKRYKSPLFLFLYRFTRNHAAAEDVFQETFLQVHLWADRFDVQRRLKPWLFTIAANKARDYLRRNKRMPSVSLDAPADMQGNATSFADLLDAQIRLPSDLLEQKEKQQLVRRIMDDLTAYQREILILAYFQQMPYKEMAQVLDVPLGTVKSRLHAAVASFARLWNSKTAQAARAV